MNAPLDPLALLGYEQWPTNGRWNWRPTLIHERLWMGGVPDSDALTLMGPEHLGGSWSPSAHKALFDAVVSLTALDGPAGTGVLELRAGMVDDHAGGIDKVLLTEALAHVLRWHRAGLRVLVRCRAGLNRSGAVAALTLMELEDLEFDSAVAKLRSLRSELVLNNQSIFDGVRAAADDPDFWVRVRSLS